MISETDWLGDVTAYTKPLGGRPAKGHTGRQRKLYCERCGFIAYASRGALERCGFPSCACGEPMALANLRDRALVEWEQLERELMAYGRDANNAAMRELGHTGMVETKRVALSGAARKRCQWEGGYCTKFASGRYCLEHANHRELTPAHRRAA